jgi:polygalacturonase
VIGSEMSGGVRNVHVEDCEFTGTDRGLRIKSMRGRGGVIENVYYRNVRHKDLRLFDVEMTAFYRSSTLLPLSQTPPTIRNVVVENLVGSGAKTAIEITGLPELPVQNVSFENVVLSAEEGVHLTDVKGIRFRRTNIEPASRPQFRLENARSVVLDEACAGDAGACVELVGKRNAGVTIDGAMRSKP